MRIVQPDGWVTPRGYSNATVATGTVVSVAGQIGWNGQEQFESDDFAAQTRQALENIVAVLAAAGATPDTIVRMTWYVVDKREYLAARREVGAAYADVIGRHYPAMTLVEVSSLLEDRARVEIEATAIVPPETASVEARNA